MIIKKGKFKVEHICNATLAGGIIIASCADLYSTLWPPLLIGWFGGICSVLSYSYLSILMKKCNLFDTRGVLHLHLVPAVLSLACSAITFIWFDKI